MHVDTPLQLFELFPACEDGQMWTKNTIDISIFHENKSNSNIYNNSYIKEYLEKVVKIKMQVSSISLPWLKNKNTDIMDTGTAQSYSDTQTKMDKLKWKKITDYTKDVHASYKTLRNINVTIYDDEYYSRLLWLGTRYSGNSYWAYHILLSGAIELAASHVPLGLRPVITK